MLSYAIMIKRIFECCNDIDLTKKAWTFDAAPYKKKRSLEQNAYLWSGVYPAIKKHIQESTGDIFTSEEIHESMMAKFIDAKPKIVLEEIVLVRSTKRMSTVEFIEYVGQIQMYWADNGLVIPDPEL